MKNLPKTIYLQVDPDDLSQEELSQLDFSDLEEITWCETNQYDNDIEYTLRWYGPDQVPPAGGSQESITVLNQSGERVVYDFLDNAWYSADNPSREAHVEKWRYPEPKKIEK